jgi:hypothetical protein
MFGKTSPIHARARQGNRRRRDSSGNKKKREGADGVSKHGEIGLSHEDRGLRARYLGALADRVFRAECARLGLDADEAIKSPLSSIIAQQGRGPTAGRLQGR